MQVNDSFEKVEVSQVTQFKEIYREHGDKILLHAFNLTKCRKSAEDIRQEVFLKVWDKRDRVFEIENLYWYLIVCCRNVYINNARKTKRQGHFNVACFNEHYVYSNNVEEGIQEAELRKLFQKSIDLIPFRRRLIFLLLEEGATYKEVAQMLCLSICTVKAQRQHAVNSIRSIVSKEWNIDSYCKKN